MTNVVLEITGPVRRVLEYEVFPSSKITVASLMALIILFILVIVVERIVRRAFVARLLRRTQMEPSMQFTLARVIGYAVLALGFFISLQMVGVNLTSLSFLAGAVGVGFGFGLQNVISNFISGLIILAERPIKIGDRVEIGGVAGEVREISLRSTTLVTNDNMAIFVPNANLITQQIINWSYEDPRVRFRIPFGVAHGTDLRLLRKLMLEVAAEHAKVLKEPKPDLFCVGITENGLNFELGVWSSEVTTTPKQFNSDLFVAIDQKLRENAIKLPAPPQARP